ncbi:hypothetical protein PT2222_120233 [Paraburkholderia tropica]
MYIIHILSHINIYIHSYHLKVSFKS